MDFHVIMPYHRSYLHDILKEQFSKMEVIWHPVCDPDEIKDFQNDTEEWIDPVSCCYLTIPGDQCYKKVNDFIESTIIVDDDYYGFLGDDDMYAPDFVNKIKKFIDAGVIITSMSRGDNYTTDQVMYNWPPVPIYQHKFDDVRVANIDFCQMIVRGWILKNTKFHNSSVCDDGEYAVHLKNVYGNDICFLPEIGVFKNFYEPNRYNTDVDTHRVN